LKLRYLRYINCNNNHTTAVFYRIDKGKERNRSSGGTTGKKLKEGTLRDADAYEIYPFIF
jgi:hypothetical protein